jgi:GNAT superfamily N-acetyltransferase
MRLREVPPEVYAREVLPLTAPLWAGRRSFAQYAEQTLEIARGVYGRRSYRTVGLYDGKRLLASFKRFERTMREGSLRRRAFGIGAVFTPQEYRGRGYASVLLASALDEAKKNRYDLAYLFSDIRPQFYAALGFRELPSREFSLRADSLPASRLDLARFGDADWGAVARLFERGEQRRGAALLRTASVWDWVRMRARHGSEHSEGNDTNLIARRGSRIAAYVFGARIPERDTFVVDEYGFGGAAGAEMLPSLLRAAAGDLRRVAGWLPPAPARAFLPKISVRKRKRAIFMIAPLTRQGERLLEAIADDSSGDFCWSTDHI